MNNKTNMRRCHRNLLSHEERKRRRESLQRYRRSLLPLVDQEIFNELEKMGFVETEYYEFQKKINDEVYFMIGANSNFLKPDEFIVYADEVDLNDFTNEKKENCIRCYYKSVALFEKYFPKKEDQNKMLAKMIFLESLMMIWNT